MSVGPVSYQFKWKSESRESHEALGWELGEQLLPAQNLLVFRV